MIPVLYNHSEKEFTSNGLGRLTECTSCIVTEERNGVFECEFTYPISGRHYEEIAEGCIIFVTHDNSGIPQPFDVYKRSVPINGEVTFNAAHISYRLGKVVLMPYAADSCADALAKIPGSCLPNCEFNFITDKAVTSLFNLQYPIAAKAILCGTEGSILDVYGTGEYKFDKFNVLLYLHRGTDTTVQIRYGKNLVDFTDEIDASETYTAVVPFWTNPETGAAKMLPETVVTADDAPVYLDFWTNELGRRITNENGVEFEFAYPNIVAVTLDLSAEFEEEPTDEQMRARAKSSANAHKDYTQTLTVDFVQLAQSDEYKDYAPLQELNLCDTCEIIYHDRPVRLKVIETEYDTLADRYTSLTLGDAPVNYADILTGELTEAVRVLPTGADVQSAIASAARTITGVNGGNVVFRYNNGKPYEILILDTESVETAVHVLRINMNGIGFSDSGVDGIYKTAWTLDGSFIANFIRSGTIQSADGNSYWDLDNAVFSNSRDSQESTNTRLVLKGGNLYFYGTASGTEELGGIMGAAGDSGTVGTHGVVLIAEPGNFAGLAYRGSGSATFSYAISANNGFNASYQEKVLIHQTARALGGLYFGANGDQAQACFIQQTVIAGWNGDEYLKLRGTTGTYIASADGYASFPTAARGFCLTVFDDAYIRTTLSAQTVTQRSDENLKNIWEYETAYDEVIDELEPISYTWREDDDTSEHVGLGARQTRRILEEHGLYNAGLVVDRNDLYSINYAELTVMLLKRVQDQTKQINNLTARLEKLEAIINADT